MRKLSFFYKLTKFWAKNTENENKNTENERDSAVIQKILNINISPKKKTKIFFLNFDYYVGRAF